MMSIRSKREVLERVVPRYWAARGAQKRRILDEFVAITGYHRRYAIHVLRHPPEPRKVHHRQRKRIYGQPVQAALVRLWRIESLQNDLWSTAMVRFRNEATKPSE